MPFAKIVQITGLLFVVFIAAVWDIRSRRIPNWLTFPALFSGLALHLAWAGSAGLCTSLSGMAAAALPFALVYLLGGMGAGDVKLMAAVGAWFSWPAACVALLATVFAGGFLALAKISWRHYTRSRPHPEMAGEKVHRYSGIPYAVAIAIGASWTIFVEVYL